MISRKQLLINMGELMDYEHFMESIVEPAITRAAANSEHTAVIDFPEKLDKEDIDQFYIDMRRLGYSLSNSPSPYKQVVVRW